jgi:hypothetical protein
VLFSTPRVGPSLLCTAYPELLLTEGGF